jgi:tetratricopeptide (TPR) repeat protein
MRGPGSFVLGVALALLAGCASYQADVSAIAEHNCLHAQTADKLIEYCDAAIKGGRVSDYRLDGVHNNRGLGHLMRKEYEPARADFDASIQSGGNHPVLYANRGDAYLGLKDFGRAIADYDTAVRVSNGGWPELYIHRGLAFLWQRDDAKALADFDRAVQLGGKTSASALIFRGLGHMAVRDYAAASADFRSALDLEPDAVAANDGLCRSLAFQGNTYEAIGRCERAVRSAKKPEGPLFARAYVRLRNGDWQGALSDCEESAQLSPVPAVPLFCAAYAQERLGNAAAAKAGYTAAREADPKVDEAMKRLGILPGSVTIVPEP